MPGFLKANTMVITYPAMKVIATNPRQAQVMARRALDISLLYCLTRAMNTKIPMQMPATELKIVTMTWVKRNPDVASTPSNTSKPNRTRCALPFSCLGVVFDLPACSDGPLTALSLTRRAGILLRSSPVIKYPERFGYETVNSP